MVIIVNCLTNANLINQILPESPTTNTLTLSVEAIEISAILKKMIHNPSN